jgi:uncharacterized GH25 family protein
MSNDPVEIVFEDHPNELEHGKSFRVRVMSFGKPVAEQEINAYSEQTSGHDASATCKTNADGYCQIEPPSHGRLLLSTSIQGDDAKVPGVDGYTYSYSVMVHIIK